MINTNCYKTELSMGILKQNTMKKYNRILTCITAVLLFLGSLPVVGQNNNLISKEAELARTDAYEKQLEKYF